MAKENLRTTFKIPNYFNSKFALLEKNIILYREGALPLLVKKIMVIFELL
jgi:hypothetical protein